MSKSCPVGPEFEALKKEFSGSEATANFAYREWQKTNPGDIPSPEQARILVNDATMMEKDEDLIRKSTKYKYDKIVEQQSKIAQLHNRKDGTVNKKQKGTLRQLYKLSQDIAARLEADMSKELRGEPVVESLSVSRFIGNSDFVGDASKYEAFRQFGNFLHDIIENGQIEATSKGLPIQKIVTEEYFLEAWEKFNKKNPIVIDQMDPKLLFEHTTHILTTLSSFIYEGAIVLPELTIMGTSNTGTDVIGRLDLVVIDSSGTINILDFKTKKMKNMIGKESGKPIKRKAFAELGNKKDAISTAKPGTNRVYYSDSRSAFDTWMVQLDVYENMLRQQGFEVGDKQIAAFMYQVSEDNKYEDSLVHVFTDQLYYEESLSHIPDNMATHYSYLWYLDETTKTNHINNLKNATNEALPIDTKAKTQEEKKKKKKEYEVNPSERKLKHLVTVLLDKVDNNINNLYESLSNLNNDSKEDKALIEIIQTRIATLKAFQEIANKNATNYKAIVRSANFFNAVETVNEDLQKLLDITFESIKTLENINFDIKKGKKQVAEIFSAFTKAEDFKAIILEMEEIVNEVAQNPENNITQDSEIRKSIAAMHANVRNIESQYKKMAVKVWVSLARTPGSEVYGKVNQQLKDYYEPQLEYLKDKKAKLEKNEAVGVLASLKGAAYNLLNKKWKKELEDQSEPEVAVFLKELEKIDNEIQRIESILEGFQDSDEFLEQYIEDIKNPKSLKFVGSELFVADIVAQGRAAFANYIASAGNSEIAVATPVIHLKNTQAQANFNTMNDPKLQNFDKLKNSLLAKGYTLEELNNLVAEWRKITFYNKDKKGIDERESFFLVKPYSQQYETDYKEKEINRKTAYLAHKSYEGEFENLFQEHKKGNVPYEEIQEGRKELERLRKERDNATKEYFDFIIKHSNKPYVDDFYSLQASLPEDIRDEISNLYHEIQEILYSVGSTDNLIEDEYQNDYDRIAEIEVSIKKLREEAKQRDPKYADYIDKFNELYEYDINDILFERKKKAAEIKYGGDPEMMERWLNENTIERPTDQWYNELSALYERKERIAEFLPPSEYADELKSLFEERRRLLAPHKRFGRIYTKSMSEEDIHELDVVQEQIDSIILAMKTSNKEGEKPDPNILEELKRINAEIDNLVNKERLSPVYEKDFETRYTDLENKWRQVNYYQNQRDAAEKRVKINATEENVKTLNEMDENLETWTRQFLDAESKFKLWFKKYHDNDYVSLSKGGNARTFRSIKKFNFERLPAESVWDQYMERVPNPKYFKTRKLRKENWYLNGEHLHSSEIQQLREDPNFDENEEQRLGRLVIKPGAENPNFHKTPEGILLPKGIQYDGNNRYSIQPGYENNPYIDSKFASIKNNPEISEFYDSLSDLFFSGQSGVEGKKIGYQIPGYASSLVERAAQTGSLTETIKSEFNLFIDKYRINSEQDFTENVFGVQGARVRLRNSTQLKKGLQSEDAITSIMKYSLETHYNKAMQQESPQIDTYIEYLKLQRKELAAQSPSGKTTIINPTTGKEQVVDMAERLKSLDNVIEILEFERRKFVYGQVEDKSNRTIKKVLDGFFAYTSFIRIGFDVANQIKNNVAGNVQAWIAAGYTDNDHYTRKDWLFGKQMLYKPEGFLHNFFKDYGRISDLSVSTMMYRFYNPAQKDPLKYFEQIGAGKKRKILSKATSIQEMGYLLQDKGESEIAITVMYAILNNHQVRLIEKYDENNQPVFVKDEDGNNKTIPAHQAYIVGTDGQLAKRSDVYFPDHEEALLRNTMYSEMRRAQGNYAKSDMTRAEETIPGKILFFYRKFLVPTFLNRFGWSRPNWEAGEVAVGYWRAVYHMFKYYGPKHATKELIFGSKTLNRFGGNGINNVIRKAGEGTIKLSKEDMALEDGEKNQVMIKNVAQARRDMYTMMLLSILSMMALAYVRQKDDDDEELGVLEGNVFRILWGVKGETLSMFPIGGGSDEYIRNFTTAVPMVREITKLKKMGEHIYAYGLAMAIGGGEKPDPDYDSQYYQEIWKDAFYTKKQGPYEAGTAKMKKDFLDLTGLRNFRDILNPEYRIDDLKKRQ